MSRTYEPEFKQKIIRLHLEEGRTYKSITAEYGVSKSCISRWCEEFTRECQTNPKAQDDYDYMKENLRLKRENEELRKENLFLHQRRAEPKKRRHSLQGKPVRGLPVHSEIW